MEYISISNVVRKMEQLNVKKLLLLFYIIIPTIFYAIPLILFLINGDLAINFYKTYYPNSVEIFEVLIGHIILGSLIYIFTQDNIIYKKHHLNEKIFYNLLTIVIFVLYVFSRYISDVITMLSFGIFIILISNVKIYKLTYFILFVISLVELMVYKERYLTVFIMILMSLSFLSKRTIMQLISFSLLGVFVLVFILQPLRYGELPFSSSLSFNLALLDIYKHLNPIYYTAYLANSINFSFESLFIEFIPFGKSLSGEPGVVDILAQVGLPQYLIAEGARLGSNSAMYFSFKGIILLIIMFGIIYGSQKFIKSIMLTNSIIMYLLVQGPYFIRRSFASFTIDIIIIICLILMILMIKQTTIILRKTNEN